jgi:hypothetical protein
MLKHIALFAAVVGLSAAPVLAAEHSTAQPTKLSDHELDQVVGGDPLILVQVMAPIGIHIEPITVTVNVPINVAAVVQANVLGNASFNAAVGTQYVFNAAANLLPSG